MKVPISQFSAAVSQYLMTHVVPAVKRPVDRFTAGIAVGNLNSKIPGMIERLGAPFVVDGMVCVDAIEANLKNGFAALEGGKLPIPIPSTGSILANLAGPDNKPLADALLNMFGMPNTQQSEMVFTEADWNNFKVMLG